MESVTAAVVLTRRQSMAVGLHGEATLPAQSPAVRAAGPGGGPALIQRLPMVEPPAVEVVCRRAGVMKAPALTLLVIKTYNSCIWPWS